ncbi:MAG: DUF91 domain-containing protein [Bacteroidetes bacterium]|nr:DUF91 domain-containing protein [Bacteroidota bacterium]
MQTEKQKFIDWMVAQNKWVEGSIKNYAGKVGSRISEDVKNRVNPDINSLFDVSNPTELDNIYKKLYSIEEIREQNKKGKNINSCAFERYIEFRKYEQNNGIIYKEEPNKIESQSQEIIDKSYLFALEAHLQDFLIGNLQIFKHRKLQLYIDESGRKGKEYPTSDGGSIDILTIDEKGNFFVFELKLARGVDKTMGQLQRYMGWVKKDLAKGKDVFGIIVANKMDDRIKYAVAVTQNITLYEYEMKFDLKELPKD